MNFTGMNGRIALLSFNMLISCTIFGQEPSKTNTQEIELMNTIRYLSSERFKGRLPGSLQYEHAAKYVATRFKSAGLKPVFPNNMLQEFNDEVNIIIDAKAYLLDRNNRPVYPLMLGEDFICRGFTGWGEVRGEVVFAGYGIKSDEYNDYRSIDVKNKIVAVFKSAPPWVPSSGSWGDVSPRGKARVALEQGAIAIIFIGDPQVTTGTMLYGSIACGPKPHLSNFPMIHAGERFTDSLFSKLPYKPLDYYQMINRDKAPHSIETEKSVYINIKAVYSDSQKTYNVVGMIEGSDPKLKNEYVILGAHLDHVGFQGDRLYFPGANDNASGVAGLIAIADTIGKLDTKPRRSIIFVAFSSEESGLKGSKYFVENMPVPPNKVIAMLNFDCIGQGQSIAVGGRLSFPRLWKMVKKIDSKTTKQMAKMSSVGGGADAQAFYEAGIPTLYFYTSGGYKYLHQTSDKPETINPDLLQSVVYLGYRTAIELANGKYKREADRLKK